MVTLCSHVAVLPWMSVTVHVTTVVPTGKLLGASLLTSARALALREGAPMVMHQHWGPDEAIESQAAFGRASAGETGGATAISGVCRHVHHEDKQQGNLRVQL